MAKLSVVVYTMKDCPFCDRAKQILREIGVKFVEKSTSDQKNLAKLRELTGGDKVPTILVNKTLLVKPGEDKLRATITYERSLAQE